MIDKREPLIASARSLVNHKWLTSEDTAIIAIFRHDNCRTIYIESGQESRTITKYSIVFPTKGNEYDRSEGWIVSYPPVILETGTEIKAIRKFSQTAQEIQVTYTEMLLFKATIDDAVKERSTLLKTQDSFIETGLERIGKSIDFTPSRSCVIS